MKKHEKTKIKTRARRKTSRHKPIIRKKIRVWKPKHKKFQKDELKARSQVKKS